MTNSGTKSAHQKLQAISALLKRLPGPLPWLDNTDPGRMFMDSGVWIHMPEEALALHAELLEILLQREGWSQKFSERYVDGQLQALYARFVNGEASVLMAGLEQVAAEFASFTTEYQCLIPLAGIRLKADGLEIGRIRLRRGTPAFLLSALIGEGIYSEELKQQVLEGVLKGRPEITCAEVRVVAEQERAREIALVECERAMEVIRYSIPYVTETHLKVAVGFEDEFQNRGRLRIFTGKADAPFLPSSYQRNSPYTDLVIEEACVKNMEKIGAMVLSDSLKKNVDTLTGFEKMLLRALHWYSAGTKASEPENAFLNYVTTLETLLAPVQGESISAAVADGCAFILADSLEKRLKLSQRVKALYGARSGLSHGGKTGILDLDLREIEFIAWHLLCWMVERVSMFSSRDSLRAWLDSQKFR
jgi:hypothetical protein